MAITFWRASDNGSWQTPGNRSLNISQSVRVDAVEISGRMEQKPLWRLTGDPMKCVPLLILCSVLAGLAGPARAWPGDPDVTFGAAHANAGYPRGLVVDPFPGEELHAPALALLSDGKIVAASGSPESFHVARFLKDGSLDPEFGEGGRVKTDLISLAEPIAALQRVVLQPDGKILVAGYAGTWTDYSEMIVMRHLPNGPPDPGFGSAGIVRISVPGFLTWGLDMALLSNGRILVLGNSQKAGLEQTAITVLHRFQPDGSPDQSFGTGGSVEIPGPRCHRMAVQADGKMVLASLVEDEEVPYRYVLFRRAADGSPDPSFGTNGTVLAARLPGRYNSVSDIVVHSDGKILLAADTATMDTDDDFLLARYNPDGSPDLSFNGTGHVLTNFPPDADGESDYFVSALAVQSDGKLVAGGSTGRRTSHAMTARFFPDGTLDTGYGTGGVAVSSIQGFCYTLAPQPDGRIVTGGFSQNEGGSAYLMTLTRIQGGEPRQGLVVEKPDGTALNFGTALDMGEAGRSSPHPLETVVTLRNYGTAPGTGFAAAFSGPDASRFTLVTPLPAKLAGQSSIPLTVRYTAASQVSTSIAWLAITSGNPPSEGVVFPLRGRTVAPVAALAVFDGTVPVEPGGTVNLGASNAEHPALRAITLKNTGNIDLRLQGISLGAEGNPNDFTLDAVQTELLAPGGLTTMSITFIASGPGVRTATLRIASTDTFNPPFTMLLRGTLPQGPDAWRLAHFGTLLNEGPAADLSDPDGDGRPNLLEYAFLTNPQSPSDTPPQLVKNGDYLEYSYSRPFDATLFLNYSLEWSNSLQGAGGWYPTGSSWELLVGDDGIRHQIKYGLFTGSLTRRFVRIRVSRK